MPQLSDDRSNTTSEQMELLSALDRSMAIIEFTPDGTVLRANRNYLKIFGYQEQQIRGLHHRELCQADYANSSAFNTFWSRLQEGQSINGQYLYVSVEGRLVWLEASYTPVFAADGQLLKIIQFASDVSTRVKAERCDNERTRLFTQIAERTHNSLLITNAKGVVVYINEAVTHLLGYQPEEVLGQPVALMLNMVYPERNPLTYIRQHLSNGHPYRGEELIYSKFQQPLLCALGVSPIFDGQGALSHTLSVITDITDIKIHEVLQQKALEAMAREAPLTEVMTLICQEVERIAPDVIASILRVDEQGRLRPLASPSLPQSYSQALDGIAIGPNVGSCGTAAFRGTSVVVSDIGSDPLWADYKNLALPLGLRSCWSTPIKARNDQVIGTFAFYYRENRSPNNFHLRLVQMCTHLCALALGRESARLQIRQLACYDSLTRLPNRNLLLAQADQAIASAKHHNQSLAVFYIDLDRFKQVNDSLGRMAGDELLCVVTERLREQISDADLLGRLSGDEFIVVLNSCTLVQAADTVKRLHELLSIPCQIAGITLTPSACIGISLYPDNGQDMETLLHHADLARYHAKTSGRKRFSFFRNEMNLLAQERLALEAALREAVRAQCLYLHYQPQVDLKSGQIHGIEALARWHDPVLGHISPTRFIPLAEECGLIDEISHWALNESCRQLAEWRRQGLNIPTVSVNVSSTNFHNLDLPRYLVETLEQHALLPGDLILEITESVMMDTNLSTMRNLHEVHALGIGLAMDDFGTGYSSLGYLRRIPLSALKLDKSFVNGMEHDVAAQALTQAVIRIGDSLNLTVIAEGVETEAQRFLLDAQGCKVGQGYLFSQPLPPDLLADWLKTSTVALASG